MNELFRNHPRTWQDFRFCYPVVSRRSRGLSLGVNLNPDQACNFDCVYCSVDRSRPPAVREVDEAELERELAALLDLAVSGEIWREAPFDRTPPALRRLNDIAFSGDGEPTSYTGFPRMLAVARRLIVARAPATKIVVITNATLFQKPTVRDALVSLAPGDEVWAKLDAGSEDWYRAVDRSDVPLSRVLGNLRDLGRLRPLVIQALWCRLHGEAPPAHEIEAWVGRLKWLVEEGARIDRVQVYTTARETTEAWATALTVEELGGIAKQAEKAGLVAEVHG